MTEKLVIKRNSCRACKQKKMLLVFSLGMTPLANSFLRADELNNPENFFPLDIYVCDNCGLVQLGHVVSPGVLFGGYIYVSSTSPVFRQHFTSYAQEAYRMFGLNTSSLIVDIGSNDGILLAPFLKLGTRVLGIEPATKIAKQARDSGIETVSAFVSPTLAKDIVRAHGRADVVTANNVFAHIDDWDEVVRSVKALLSDDGVFIIEAPYLVDFIEKSYFDLIYHEHLSYLALRPLNILFARFGMAIFDVHHTPVHGGSIRIFVKRASARWPVKSSVSRFFEKESRMHLGDVSVYSSFEKKILLNKARLVNLLIRLKIQGKSIAAYGAPAKGNTLLTYFGIGREILDFVIDDSPWKQKLFTPGTHIPVVSSKTLYDKKPDYLLLLAWNFAHSIMKTHRAFHDRGGRFIIPVPSPHIVTHV